MFDCLEIGYQEDCPYCDLTTETLNIKGEGVLKFITRENAIISGTPNLKRFFESKNLKVISFKNPCESVKPEDIIFEATGDLKTLFKMWRICQTYLTVLCAITTQTNKLVCEARKVNPDVLIVAASRKTHLGMRREELQAVIDGGAECHRNSLSDSIMITQNHLRMIGKLTQKPYSFSHKIELEPKTEEEAYEYADKTDIMILDRFEIDKITRMVKKLRELNPALKIGIAGQITLENIKNYVSLADFILLSSVLYAKPLNFTCRIEKLNN
ncbi:MAG: quinolinate phosphoribosyl transferase [bacterium]